MSNHEGPPDAPTAPPSDSQASGTQRGGVGDSASPGVVCGVCGREEWEYSGPRRSDACCAARYSWATREDCYRLGYEREKASHAVTREARTLAARLHTEAETRAHIAECALADEKARADEALKALEQIAVSGCECECAVNDNGCADEDGDIIEECSDAGHRLCWPHVANQALLAASAALAKHKP